jgi:polysaccharide export outer membrane protein
MDLTLFGRSTHKARVSAVRKLIPNPREVFLTMTNRPMAAVLSLAAFLPASLLAQAAPPASTTGSAPGAITVTAPKAAGQASSTYRISAGDQVEVYVWGDERLQRALTVLPDGTFGFPLAGTVMAAGHTTNDVERELSRLLAPQYKGVAPEVTVSVKQSTGMQISVIGKVKAPGTFSPTRYVTVLDALALAGGPTEFADVGNIVVLRNTGGKSSIVRSRLANVLKGRPTDSDLAGDGIPQLLAGDTVVVP